MRRLRAWAAELEFPEGPAPGRGFANYKIALPEELVGPLGRPQIVTRAAQVLVDAAGRLARLKPKTHRSARVVAILGRPDLFASEICVFFDEAYFRDFSRRASTYERWAPIEDRSLAQDWGLTVPDDFSETGFETSYRDDEDDAWTAGETWLIGELGPST
jgi:hypothetical protein